MRIPGGPPRASALLLRGPKALLAKQWARRDEEAPLGGAYLFLAVHSGPGRWVFSTDPVQRLPIRSLAEALQAAEAKADAVRAASDPWFDGKPFGHTLVASPRVGTRLEDSDVLRAVRAWAGARRAPTRRSRRRAIVAVALMSAVLAGALAWALKPRDAGPFPAIDFRSRGEPLDEAHLAAIRDEGGGMRGFALLVAVGANRRLEPLMATEDAAKVYRVLRDRYAFDPKDMVLLVDEPARAFEEDGTTPLPVSPGPPDLDHVHKAMDRLGNRVGALVDPEHTEFVFYYAGHGVRTGPGEKVGYLALAGWLEDRSAPRDRLGYDMAHLPGDVRRKVGCTHSLLLIDACYSGLTVNKRGDPSENPSRVYEMWDDPALVVITAGQSDQEVPEGSNGSYFTEVLLDGLGARADRRPLADASETKDGIVTDAELGAWLAQAVPDRVRQAGSSMQVTPLYFRGLEDDDVGQFLFVRSPAR